MNKLLFLDIEIARDGSVPHELYLLAQEKHPEQYMFLPAYNQIISICVGYENNAGQFQLKALEGDEAGMISKLFGGIDQFAIVGYNILQFDLPFIVHRAMRHGIKIPNSLRAFGKKPWEMTHIIDLMQVSKSFGLRYYSLADMCLLLGIQSPKEGMDGSQVQESFEAGRIDDINHYCMADVLATKNLFDKLQEFNVIPHFTS